MANTLTGLIPTLYQSLDIVSREMVGFIPSVALNADGARAALNESITIPVTGAETAVDVTPGVYAPDNGDTTVGSTTMTISKSRMVPVRFSGEELVGLGNAGTKDRILQARFAQAFRVLANEVEADLAAQYKYASRAYGTAGTTPFASSLGDTAQVRKILADNGAPMGDLSLVINTAAGANLRSLANLTRANEAGTDATLRRGVLLDINGLAIRESAQIKSITAGTITANVTVSGAHTVGDTTITVATGANGAVKLNAGDIITFAGDSNKYVVAAAVSIGTNSTGTITIAAPGLRVAKSGSEAVSAGASFTPNVAFDRNAIQLITRTPAMPDGGDSADDVMNITDPVSGISFQVALYRQYRQIKYEIGLAWGVKAIKPEHIAILLG